MERETGRIDPRIARTRAALVEALVGLCAEQEYESISVADIARKAGVNRATFYLHYEDKEDLLERGFEGFLENLGRGFTDRPPGMDDEEWLRFRMVSLFTMLKERRTFFTAILSGVGTSALMDRATSYLERFLIEYRLPLLRLSKNENPVPVPALARAVVSTLLGFISYWLGGEGRGSADDIADWYIRFVRGGFSAAGYRYEPE